MVLRLRAMLKTKVSKAAGEVLVSPKASLNEYCLNQRGGVAWFWLASEML